MTKRENFLIFFMRVVSTPLNHRILEQVGNLKASSVKMQDYINSVGEKTELIDKSSSELVEISTKVSETINQIGSQIDQFEV